MEIRWTIHKAAQAFNIHRETLGKKLIAASVIPGPDQKYSFAQLLSAVFGDYESEKTRLTKENADIAAIKKNQLNGELVLMATVVSVWSKVTIEFRQWVLSLEIPQQKKEEGLDLLTEPKINEYIASASIELEDGAETDTEAA